MIDFRQPNLRITVRNKHTNEIIVSGLIETLKDLPELMFSFDSKHFFVTRDNPLFEFYKDEQNLDVEFDAEKYKEVIYPYKGLESRNNKDELIFREFSIDELDPEIEPLVMVLNKHGFKTTGSCCGHDVGEAWIHISFKDFVSIKKLVSIIQQEQFRFKFVLTTSSHIVDDHKSEVRFCLQTTSKGQQAYQDVLDLTKCIDEQCKRFNKIQKLMA